MKLLSRLMLPPAVCAAAMVAIAAASAWMLVADREQSAAAQAQIEHTRAALTEGEAEIAQLRIDLYRTIALAGSLDSDGFKKARAALAGGVERAERAIGVALAAEGVGDDTLRQALPQTLKGFAEKASHALNMALDPSSGMEAMQPADALVAQLRDQLKTLTGRAAAQRAATLDAIADRSHAMLGALAAAAALAVAGALALAWLTLRQVVRDLHGAVDTARRVAAGELAEVAASRRDDELGELLAAQGEMVVQLRGLVTQVRDSAACLQTASGEVAAGNQDLSQRTEEAAANLEQTASAMEQLSANVANSADAARQANELAGSASDVAQRGGAMVDQLVATMQEIDGSSKQIADIIGLIDGIAFQTNILALNAAVEAARAGEQGRGFAVVAGEVRALAQRSAEAARQIKGLIGSSVDKVETGSRLVQDAGATMGEIVASVRRVTEMIDHIATAANEQSSGIGQIHGAITQLDRMTQQNAALVEQSAAASSSVKEQATRLNGVVATFQIA